MRWEGNRQSENVEDRRDEGGGGGFGLPIGGRGIGLGTVAVALVAGWIFGINPLTVLGLLSGNPNTGAPPAAQAPAHAPPAGDRQAAFVATVLGITEDVWGQLFQQSGARYRPPHLVLFRGVTPTACGTGQAAMGPFYCPGDQKVYIDLAFYDTLQRQLGAPGDFAQAYVIAHEVGHHVQNLMGITGQVDQRRGRMGQAQANALSVRVELQADCFAGVWAHHADAARQILEGGDVEEALNAASRIGDDALQGQSQGRVVPETFTHGTSAQRVGWFRRGLQSGSVGDCDTFKARQL
ncbi:KPN_02809 family neutral zinc metallopeptidase [Ideonella sp.]|uniref:KPN_02809 family neutral zinc metallopeptidase n=1 Tax=Ideonella sp. TaxID=1929293 RepID=UPI002B48BB3D|nr:neutral zinc metallopeptidase [Ideonella sp.]HJV68602.1 neutral zinc metallopeptidase [Ideonella sp.]